MPFVLYLLLTGLSIFIGYFIWQTQKIRAFSRVLGCQSPPQYSHTDSIFGLDLFFQNGKAIADDRFLPELQQRYQKYGKTFGCLSFGRGAIASVDPENLRTIWVTKYEDWGVQPLWLRAMAQFAGRAFISMDGLE
jgi:hypothetical protein